MHFLLELFLYVSMGSGQEQCKICNQALKEDSVGVGLFFCNSCASFLSFKYGSVDSFKGSWEDYVK